MLKLSVLSAVEMLAGTLVLEVASGAEGGGDAAVEDGGGAGTWADCDCGV